MKAYGLRVLKDDESYWSNIIAVSNDYNKLIPFIITKEGMVYVGSYDNFNAPNVVRYTSENDYPRYMIEEIPYVV